MKILFKLACIVFLFVFKAHCQSAIDTVNFVNGIRFVPNQGQICDEHHQPRTDVLFHVEGKGIFLRDVGITYVLVDSSDVNKALSTIGYGRHTNHNISKNSQSVELEAEFSTAEPIKAQQISMVFKDINSGFVVSKSGQSSDYLNYYLEQCPQGLEHVYSYKKITYSNIYDGIDVEFFGNEKGDLKYDYIIEPFADPLQIKLEWLGADSVYIDKNGELVLDNGIRMMKEAIPLVYQLTNNDTIKIEAAYKLDYVDGNYHVSFILGEYDKERSLIIDPWVTNYGGENADGGRNVTIDNLGDVVVTGYTHSALQIAQDGHMNVFGGLIDGFAVKFSPNGNRIWGTFYGGSNEDDMVVSAVDSNNDIVCVGFTNSLSGISYLGFQMIKIGPSDGFIVKFSTTGIRLWATYFGGDSNEYIADVKIASNDDIYVMGPTSSSSGIASLGAYQTVLGGSQDLFLAKFTSVGAPLWATYIGGENSEYSGALALYPDGTSYLTGKTNSLTGIATVGAYQEIYANNFDAILVKFDALGNRIWGTYLGTEFEESGADVATDTLGNIYVAGDTYSETGLSFAGYQMTNAGPGGGISYHARDAYLAQFNPGGVLQWATYLGGTTEDYGQSVAVDNESNNVIISGDTYSSNFPTTGCGTQSSLIPAFGENAFITQFDVHGNLYCSSYFGNNHEEGTAVSIGGCYIYLTGGTPSNISTPGSHQDFFGGGYADGFVAQLYKFSCGIDEPIYELIGSQTDVSSCLVCDGIATVSIVSDENCFENQTINYRWSNGVEFLNSTESTSTVSDICATENFWVEVELACGFFDTLFFDLSGGDGLPKADFSVTNFCIGDTTNFINSSIGTGLTYFWEFGDGNTSDLENPSNYYNSPGSYLVTLYVEDDNGCLQNKSLEIIISNHVSTSIYSSVCYDSLYTFPNGVQKNIKENMQEITHLETVNGCDSIVYTYLTVLEGFIKHDTLYVPYNSLVYFHDGETQLIVEQTEHFSLIASGIPCDSIIHTTVYVGFFDFYPPNIFTPDGDDRNDFFYFPLQGIATFECVIVNRWGVEVFKFNSISDKWNGLNTKNGKECVDGVYFYSYSGSSLQGDPIKGQGTVELIRGN